MRKSRDVGEWLNLTAGPVLVPEGRLLRGGKIDAAIDAAEIGSPHCIISLRGAHDRFCAQITDLTAR